MRIFAGFFWIYHEIGVAMIGVIAPQSLYGTVSAAPLYDSPPPLSDDDDA